MILQSKLKSIEDGFTLIELLMVMSLMVLLTTFIGPVAIQQLEKAHSNSELKELESILTQESQRAYFTNSPSRLVFNNDRVTVFHAKKEMNHVFDSLYFSEKQEVIFNKIGYSEQDEVNVLARNKTIKIELQRRSNDN